MKQNVKRFCAWSNAAAGPWLCNKIKSSRHTSMQAQQHTIMFMLKKIQITLFYFSFVAIADISFSPRLMLSKDIKYKSATPTKLINALLPGTKKINPKLQTVLYGYQFKRTTFPGE